ncbi:MAG: S-layer homology domain-containing protein [Xenococcaceae cyanobacterium MO_188.B32]|nr:S-layer homology domain-containing protein [Xenococcaceae cyanobacterium MO_188.B32]
MFQKYSKFLIYWTISASLLAALTACTEGKTLENFLGPDPQLQKSQEQTETDARIAQDNTSKPQKAEPTSNRDRTTDRELTEEINSINVPENFPDNIPIYPQAKLLEIETGTTGDQGKTTWQSPDNLEQITNFYQQKFLENQWDITQTPESDYPEENTLIAIKDNLEIVLFLYQLSTEPENNSVNTEFTIEYQPIDNNVEFTEEIVESESNLDSIATIQFSDLNETPEQLHQYVRDVATLGILTPYEQDGKINLHKFAPNQPITRREYARWLVDINNHFYASSSGNKIHLATKSDQPAFKDIGINDPDYKVIQGLAEAGLIPSILMNDGSKLLFQPDAPLTRENLISWKVPLDLRKALPPASIESIADSWGFQDASNINPEALKALFADFQNGEQANVRRVFGYTTLFQPKKPVTRAEAAASLWYLGFQGEGINAQEAFKLKEEK